MLKWNYQLIFNLVHPLFLGYWNLEGLGEERIHEFGGDISWENTHMEDGEVEGKITLSWVLGM